MKKTWLTLKRPAFLPMFFPAVWGSKVAKFECTLSILSGGLYVVASDDKLSLHYDWWVQRLVRLWRLLRWNKDPESDIECIRVSWGFVLQISMIRMVSTQDGCDWLMQKSRQEMCQWLRLLNLTKCLPQKFSPASKQLFHSLSVFRAVQGNDLPPQNSTPRNAPWELNLWRILPWFRDLVDGNSLKLRFWREFTQVPLTAEVWLGLKVWSRDSLLMFWVVNVPDVSSKSNFAEWESGTSDTSAFFHGSRCKDKGPTSLWEKVPQTCHCQESSLSQFWANLRRSRDRGRRVPYSSCTSTTTGSNRGSSRRFLRLLVSRR